MFETFFSLGNPKHQAKSTRKKRRTRIHKSKNQQTRPKSKYNKHHSRYSRRRKMRGG